MGNAALEAGGVVFTEPGAHILSQSRMNPTSSTDDESAMTLHRLNNTVRSEHGYGPFSAGSPVSLVVSAPATAASFAPLSSPSLTVSFMDAFDQKVQGLVGFGSVCSIQNLRPLAEGDPAASVGSSLALTEMNGVAHFSTFGVGGRLGSVVCFRAYCDTDVQKLESDEVCVQLAECSTGEEANEDTTRCSTCRAGTYDFTGSGVCPLCPLDVAKCEGSTILAEQGRYVHLPNTTGVAVVYDCVPGHCGGPLSPCLNHRKGTLCRECEEGWFNWGTKCVICEKTNWPLFVATLCVPWAIVVGFFLLYSLGNRRNAGITKSFVYFSQVVMLVVGPNRLWDTYISPMNMKMGSILTSFQPAGTVEGEETCTIRWDFYDVTVATLASPLVFESFLLLTFVFHIVGAFGISKVYKRRPRPQLSVIVLQYRYVSSVLLLYTYPIVAGALFDFTFCRSVGDEVFLSAATHVSCDDARYVQWKPAILAMLTMWMAIPAGIILTIWHLKRTGRLGDIWVHFAVFMDTYKTECWWWEMIVVYRRVGVVVCHVALAGNVILQQLLIGLTCFMIFYLHIQVKPFHSVLENEIETVVLFSLNIISVVTIADMARSGEVFSGDVKDGVYGVFIFVPFLVIVVTKLTLWSRKLVNIARRVRPGDAVEAAEPAAQAQQAWPKRQSIISAAIEQQLEYTSHRRSTLQADRKPAHPQCSPSDRRFSRELSGETHTTSISN